MQQRVSTLPASHVYNKTEFHSTTSDPGYNVLRHHSDTGSKLAVASQPYDMLDSTESNRSSIGPLHPSAHISPRTSPSSSRKSSYSSLHTFGDSITQEVYEDFSMDQPDGGDYGKLDHAHRPPEIPMKKASSEYGRLSQTVPFEPSTQQSEYGKLDHGNRPPVLPQKRNVVQENEYGRLDHTGRIPELPQRKPVVQENEYGRLDHASGYRTAHPQKRAIVQDNEYGRLDYSKRQETKEPENKYGNLDHDGHPPELPPRRTIMQGSEYGKLEHSARYVRTPEPRSNIAPDLPQRNMVQESEYGRLAYPSHSDPLEVPSSSQESEYSQLNHSGLLPEGKGNNMQSSQQNALIMQQQNNYQNQGENFLSAQQSSSKHKPQIPQRKNLPQEHSSHSESAEVSSNLQAGEIPSGYATFKREHGYSISSSVAYNSDQDDQLADQSAKYSSVPGSDSDTEYYSRLNLITDDASSSIQALKIQPNPSYAGAKPQPKPRNI